MKECACLTEPPLFDLPPPPDPSLIWHLISDEKFEPAEACSSSQFVSISDIGTGYDEDDDHQQVAANILIAIAALSVVLLCVVCFAVIGRIRRKRCRQNSDASKKMSSNSILTAGEHLWTYNSMKQPAGAPAVLMYSNNSNSGSRLFHHTPTTLRSYVAGGSGTPIMAPPIRHSESTTLRLNPGEGGTAYHTVSVSRQNGIPASEVYEEIAPIGTIGHMGYMTTRPVMPTPSMSTLSANQRMSLRKPPPTCRPPKPPQSPVHSDGSYEITRITGDSPRERPWTEDGRESGYGTAPSLQWKSPSGSARLDAEAAARAMTYV